MTSRTWRARSTQGTCSAGTESRAVYSLLAFAACEYTANAPQLFRLGPRSVALETVFGFSGVLIRTPPVLMFPVPLDCLVKSFGEIGESGTPTKLTRDFRCIDRIAFIAARPIASDGCPMHSRIMRSTSMLLISPFAPTRYVSPIRPCVRIAHTAVQWSSTLIQSRTAEPVPYSFGRIPARIFVICRGMNFSTCWYGP